MEEVVESGNGGMDDALGGSEVQNTNPKKVLDAVISPSSITMGQMALLEKVESPLLKGVLPKTWKETLRTLWVLAADFDTAAAGIDRVDELALEWSKNISGAEYKRRIRDAQNGIVAFWSMLPSPDNDSKKKSDSTRTDGSAN